MAAICFNADSGPCAVCGVRGSPCARCRVDYYCSKDHQRQDWQRHKKGCGVIEARTNSLLGRHVVAVKDIPAGTVVMRDSPLVLVPDMSHEVHCAGCCRSLTGGWSSCCRCGWPVCGKSCSEADDHRAVCAAFQRAKFELSRDDVKCSGRMMWTALAALKVYLASEGNPRVLGFQSEMADQDPADVARGGLCLEMQAAVDATRGLWRSAAQWLRAKGLHWLSEDKLYRAAGIVWINAIAVSALEASDDPGSSQAGPGAAALYAGYCMVQHDCVPTATSFVDAVPCEDRTRADRLVLASRDIRAGEHLSFDYPLAPLLPASQRRYRLRTWGFVCRCSMCEDPTERGLFLDSACCTACKGRGKRHYMLAGEVSSSPTYWRCESCGHEVRGERPDSLEASMLGALQRRAGTVSADYERFVEQHLWPKGILHPTHHLVLDAKWSAVSLVHPDAYILKPPTPGEMRRVAVLCKDLLSALDAAGRFQCGRRTQVLGPLALALRVILRADIAEAGRHATRKQLHSFAPRVRELEATVKQLVDMMPRSKRCVQEQPQDTELEMWLVITGCKVPSMSDISKVMQAL